MTRGNKNHGTQYVEFIVSFVHLVRTKKLGKSLTPTFNFIRVKGDDDAKTRQKKRVMASGVERVSV